MQVKKNRILRKRFDESSSQWVNLIITADQIFQGSKLIFWITKY